MYSITLVSSEEACLSVFSKAGKIGGGNDKRIEGGGFVPGTEKDVNETTQKETETKEISGRESNQGNNWLKQIIVPRIIELH